MAKSRAKRPNPRTPLADAYRALLDARENLRRISAEASAARQRGPLIAAEYEGRVGPAIEREEEARRQLVLAIAGRAGTFLEPPSSPGDPYDYDPTVRVAVQEGNSTFCLIRVVPGSLSFLGPGEQAPAVDYYRPLVVGGAILR